MMKNMKTSMRLGIGFMTVVMLSMIIGVVGIYGILRMDSVSSDMYVNKAKPLGSLAEATEFFQRLRVQTRNAIVYTGNAEMLKTVESDMNKRIEQFKTSMRAYEPSIASDAGRKLYEDITYQYNKSFESGILEVLEGAKRGETVDELLASMATTTEAANIIADDLSKLTEARMDVMSTANDDSTRLGQLLFLFIVVILIAAIVVSLLISLYISGLISRPVIFMKEVLNKMGTKGTVSFTSDEYSKAENYASNRDEIGESIQMLISTFRRMEVVSKALERIADGDLTVEINVLSGEDTIGKSMSKMMDNLNQMFGDIGAASAQVSTAAKQISDGAQGLAQGTTEQAASTQQLSSSIAEMSQQTKDNAEMANKASELANTIRGNAQTGSEQMERMTQAVKEINEASQSIGKIIKVIDDIAFQTNILALNAAVEAARAGQHGKGFAVVAEEVRNLAAKSADAAKSTSEIIEASVQKAEMGVKIADETAASLVEIVSGINESSKIVGVIAQSSESQTASIEQINTGISQVAQVVQTNSATAEQSAAASQEMRGQSDMLQSLVAQFKLRSAVAERNQHSTPARLAIPARAAQPSMGGDFGKY